MKLIRFVAGCLMLSAAFMATPMARACPLCADAIANSNEVEDDRDDFPAAMNQSIYLMLGVPYLSFGVVGFMIYRGVKKNETHLRAQQDTATPQPSI